MQESSSPAPAEGVAAYVGIDWADQKHDVILRAAAEPARVEHSRIAHEPNALMDWLGELQRRFAAKGKILIALEQSRGALFRDLPGAGTTLGPRLLTAFGTDRERFDHPIELSSLSGIGPVRRASGKKTGKKASNPDLLHCSHSVSSSA